MANQLIFMSLADIFSVYPQIFQKIVHSREKITHVYLPSDTDWQEKMYYRLLEVQKRVNEAMECEVEVQEKQQCERILFDPTRMIRRMSPSVPPSSYEEQSKCYCLIPKIDIKANSVWTMQNIAKAAKLLRKPPMQVDFENEQEMRRVYSVIYDVFRYKNVLSNALKDISFFETFTEYKMDQSRIWLMLFELYQRNFKQRNSEEFVMARNLYSDAKVEVVADHLWKYRVPLAASISKMRIVYGALHLSQLLPVHLQNEKVAIAASNPVVTGWINPFVLRDRRTTDDLLTKMDLKPLKMRDGNNEPLKSGEYIWDNICPLFTSCIPIDINTFSRSELMAGKYFIMQNKSFAFGPATMANLLDVFELDGDILQTHIASPRSTAYLASLLHSVNRLNTFYVYGAGAHLQEYRSYMDNLGITNIRLFAESFTSIPLDSSRFGSVVGIFANPPNSFSAVSDPIDFICSRGGDLSMLEVLTEFEINEEGKHRVTLILEEQLLTLQLAMSRPQIQFVLYQTHSLLNTENQDMVRYVIDLVNGSSLEKHRRAYRERKRLEALVEAEAANIPSAALSVGSPRKRSQANPSGSAQSHPADDKSTKPLSKDDTTPGKSESNAATNEVRNAEEAEETISLPDCDEFVTGDIPDICLNQDSCVTLKNSGSYLCLIKRKNITRLNAKYLIKMAEIRGLFGRSDLNKSAKLKTLKTQDTTLQKPSKINLLDAVQPRKAVFDIDVLITRLNTHTSASLLRSHLDKLSTQSHPLKFNRSGRECQRYRSMISKPSRTSRLLWRNAFLCIKKFNKDNYTMWCLSAYQSCYGMNLTSFRMKCKSRRKPYPIHIREIKLLLQKVIV